MDTSFLTSKIKSLESLLSPSLRRLAGYLPEHRGKIGLAVLFMLLAGGSSSLIALLLGKLTDAGFYEQEAWVVMAAPIGLIAIALLHGTSMFMSNYMLGRASQAILMKLRRQMFARMLHWPAEICQQQATGRVSSKFVFEANFMLGNAAKSAITLVRDTVQVIALTVVLFWHNWLLAMVSFIIGPLVVMLLRWIADRMQNTMDSNQASIGELLVHVKEAYRAERVIKMANAYERETKKFNALNQTIRDQMLRMTKISVLGAPLTQLLCMAGIAIVLTAAMFQTQAGLLTMGEFVTFLAALLLIMPPLRHLAGLNATFVRMNVASKSLFSLLDTKVEKDEGREVLQNIKGRVEFENVSLRYPGKKKDAVHKVSLTAEPGDTVALVGVSGSGKSSLVSMIPRFWNPASGRILIDGVNTQSVTLESLRDKIALVTQDVMLFDDTIRANITYATPNASDEEIAAAVEAAALKSFIDSLPEGINSPVGEAGECLSGGQKQRISIARAILKNAPILILDEATSALDAESERQIKEALRRLMKGRTTFMVAHRYSSIEYATKICVLQEGSLAEEGTWNELLEKNGVFAHLCRLQGIDVPEASEAKEGAA